MGAELWRAKTGLAIGILLLWVYVVPFASDLTRFDMFGVLVEVEVRTGYFPSSLI